MDLEIESSVLECVEDNEVSVSESLGNVSENTVIDSNGSSSNVEHVEKTSLAGTETEGFQAADIPQPKVESSGLIGSGSTPQAKKGYKLKKWKRIPRESSREGGNSVDNSKAGKRGLSSSAPTSRNPRLSAEIKEQSEGSVSSTNAVVKGLGVVVDGFDSGFAFGPGFAAAADSEISEDRSSKSSTAASAPRLRYEIPIVGVYMGDNNGIGTSNGDHNSASQSGQLGKSRTGTGKKPRGVQVKMEKENSHSSLESDSRSSNFVFLQGASSATSKGRQSRRSANYDGENSDEVQGSEQHFAQELQAGFRKNMSEFEDVSQSYIAVDLNGETKGENGENDGLSTDQDPLVESIDALQSAQEALAQELQKFREIGKDDDFLIRIVDQDGSSPSEFRSIDPRLYDPYSWGYDQARENLSDSEIGSLKQYINELESKLEEARCMLEIKECKIIELESALKSNASRQEENKEIIESEQRNCKHLETELEGLFKEKLEAEVEYLVISRTVHSLRVASVDRIAFLEEQKTLASEQAQMLHESVDIGEKASLLKRRVDKLETEIDSDEVKKLKKKACKFASLFFIQLALVFVIFCWFVLHLAPHHTEDVPT